jgi:microcystin-dependent protein
MSTINTRLTRSTILPAAPGSSDLENKERMVTFFKNILHAIRELRELVYDDVKTLVDTPADTPTYDFTVYDEKLSAADNDLLLINDSADANTAKKMKISAIKEGWAPVGSGLTWYTETPPDNYLECDGSSLLRTSYSELFAVIGVMYGAVDATHFNLPDSRGRVERAWDHGAGIDPDAATRTNRGDGTTGDRVGTKQAGDYKAHNHEILTSSGGSGGIITRTFSGGAWMATTTAPITGGNETRMINVNVMKCIKYQEG